MYVRERERIFDEAGRKEGGRERRQRKKRKRDRGNIGDNEIG